MVLGVLIKLYTNATSISLISYTSIFWFWSSYGIFISRSLNHLDKYKRRCEEYHSSDKKSLPRLARKSHGFTRDDTRFIGTRYISNKSFGSRRKRVRSVNMIPTWRHRAIWSNSTRVLFNREKRRTTRVIVASVVVVIFLNWKRRNSRLSSRNSMLFARYFPLLHRARRFSIVGGKRIIQVRLGSIYKAHDYNNNITSMIYVIFKNENFN